MTSATVTQLGEMIAGITNNTGNMDMQNGEFAGIFQTVAEKTEAVEKSEPVAGKATVVEKTMNVSKKANELNGQKAEAEEDKSVDVKTVEKELEKATEELKAEIAEKLDISVEELEAVMETLGLTDASLFTQEGMTALVMEIEQITTPVELLTNAEVYQTLQDLNLYAQELLGTVKEELQLTDAQLEQAIAEIEESTKMMSEAPEQKTSVVESESGLTEDSVHHVTEADEQEVVSKETNKNADTEATQATDETNVTDEMMKTESSQQASQDKSSQHQTGQNGQMAAESSIQQNNTQTVNQTVTDFSQNISGGNLSTQEIYDQIGEYIKTNIKPGISEVEMQLNPENLGTVHIHLSAKQGNVNAQLTVQNELVKAALEVQLIQLKENFAEQGIKVDAVEVTVESHAFNQNMQQSSEENGQAQAEAKRSATRSINLNGDWTEEELTEEEQLVAEMMEADGNTVDYKA